MRSAPESAASEEFPQRLTGRRLYITLAALMLTLFMSALESTIVATALPTVVKELNGFEHYSWIATGYLLASTAMVPLVSKLSDIYGRKRQLMITIAGFVAGSALCGMSQNMEQLIAFRVIQGIAGGGLFALVFAGSADIFTPAERGKWQAFFFAMFTTASLIGPTAGGWITEHISWRGVFYVNIPMCIVVLTIIYFGYPDQRSESTHAQGWRRIDFPGLITLVTAIVAFLLAIVNGGQSFRWFQPLVLGLFALAIASLALFFWFEKHAVEPILPLDLFKHRVVAVGSCVAFMTSFLMMSSSLYAPLYYQAVVGDSPTQSGTNLMPQILTGLVANIVTGQLLARRGRYKALMMVGCVLAPLGMVGVVLVTPTEQRLPFIISMMVFAAGFSNIQPAMNVAIQNALPQSRMGVGTGAVTMIRSIGQTVGAAAIGSIVVFGYAQALPSHLPAEVNQLPPAVVQQLTSAEHVLPGARAEGPALPADIDQGLVQQVSVSVTKSLALGLQTAYGLMLGVAILATALIVFLLPDAHLRGAKKRQPEQEAEAAVREPVAAA